MSIPSIFSLENGFIVDGQKGFYENRDTAKVAAYFFGSRGFLPCSIQDLEEKVENCKKKLSNTPKDEHQASLFKKDRSLAIFCEIRLIV